jgi:hypothetical protein
VAASKTARDAYSKPARLDCTGHGKTEVGKPYKVMFNYQTTGCELAHETSYDALFTTSDEEDQHGATKQRRIQLHTTAT